MKQLAYRLLDEAVALAAQDRRDEALSRFESALREAQKLGVPRMCATIARSAGLAYEHYGQLDEAVRCLQLAAANEPDDGRTYLVLASLENGRGNSHAAMENLRRALQIAADGGDDELKSLVKRSGLGEG